MGGYVGKRCYLWREKQKVILGRGHSGCHEALPRTPSKTGALTCQPPGRQSADGSELSPLPANTLDLTWWLWSQGLGPKQGQSFSIIIIYPITAIVTTTANCPQYLFSPSSLAVEPPICSWTHGLPQESLHFPASLAVRCGHVTKFLSIGCEVT